MTLTHDPDCARARKSLQALAGGPGPVLGTKHPPPSPPAARPLSDLLGGGVRDLSECCDLICLNAKFITHVVVFCCCECSFF